MDKKKALRELKRKAKYVKTILRNGDIDSSMDNLAKETKDELFKTGVIIEQLIED